MKYRFEFDGSCLLGGFGSPAPEGFCGFLTDERLEREKEDRKNDTWLHIYPTMDFENFTKERLWSDVKDYIAYRGGGVLKCNNRTFKIVGKNIKCVLSH